MKITLKDIQTKNYAYPNAAHFCVTSGFWEVEMPSFDAS
jgi:hypothetical protein